MSRFATALLAGLVASGFAIQPTAAAGKVVALVIGNEAPDNGLNGSELNAKLKELKDNLFRYGNESIIFEGANLSRDGLLTRIRAFESGLPDAEVAIFYYVGLGAHGRDGDSYLVPQGWDGSQAADLVSIRTVLDRMRANDKTKSLVFLDAIQPKGSPGWRVPDIRPGLGSLSREADPERLQIAFVDVVPEAGGSAGLLTGAMVKRLQPDRIKLPQLAALIQQDVSVDTGGMYAPRVFGSVSGTMELQRLSTDEFQMKAKRCLDQRQQAAATTTAPAVAQASADAASTEASLDDTTRLSAPSDIVASRTQSYRFWDWFCPDYTPPQVERRRVPQGPHSVSKGPSASGTGTPRTRVGSSYGGGRSSPSYGGGGVGHARAAASGVPTP